MLIATASVAENEEGAEFMRQTLPDSYNNESGRKLAESLQRMFQYTTADAMHADYDVAFSNFFAGHVAMLPTGYWLIDQIPEGWEDRIRFATFPENTMVASPETFGWAIVSTYSDEVKEAAVEFLKFRTYYNKEEKETLFPRIYPKAPRCFQITFMLFPQRSRSYLIIRPNGIPFCRSRLWVRRCPC